MNKFNGWQRLWLVGTVCLGLWLIGWWPLQFMGEPDRSYQRAIEKDFGNSLCRPYQTAPISSLTEPPWHPDGGSCWHIYPARLYDHTVPYTLEAYDRVKNAAWREAYLQVVAFGAIGTMLLSAFAYLCGWVVGWIYRGFRKASI
jgi:hypothetical protein